MDEENQDKINRTPVKESKVSLQSSLIPGLHTPTHPHAGNLLLPKTPIEAFKMSREISHKALEMVGKSLCAQRSSNRAVIFLYGLSGAGKSSTLNHLFNNKTSVDISHNRSGSRDVVEYVGSMTSEYWCADDLEISFIDAPGFNDSAGRYQDALNLANIEQFITQHQQLGLQNFAKFVGLLYTYAIFYPNIVLIVVDANDERLFGYDTEVGRMLRTLGKKRLRVVDIKRPNVVFVMTHVCGIAKGNWQSKLESKAYCLQLLGRRYLKILAPVVYIENDHEAWDLIREGEWTVLHNGERQPLNLFKKCIEIMQLNRDEVGIEAMRLYYGRSMEIPLVLDNYVKGKLFTGKNEEELSETASYWLRKVSTPFEALKTTNVDLKINAYIKSEKDEQELYPLKFILQKNNFTEVDKISSLTLPEIESILIPYRLSNLEKQVICQLFNPIQPKPEYIAPVLGCGFNIFDNTILKPVIDTSQVYEQAPYNFILPTGASLYDYMNTEATCHGVKHISDFAREMLINVGLDKYSKYAKFPLISGYNIIDSNSVPKKDCKISFRVDQTIYRVNLASSDSYPLCSDLLKDVGNLPETFQEGNEPAVRAFSAFFKKYGYWAITQATLGGCIEGVMSVDRANALREDYYTTIRKLVIIHIGNTINGAKFSDTFDSRDNLVEEEQIYNQLLTAELTWKGGDARHHASSLGKLTSSSWNAWTESLKLNPIIFQHNFTPITLHFILHSHNHSRAMPVQKAYEYLTNNVVATKTNRLSSLPDTRGEASNLAKSEIKSDSCFPSTATVRLDSGRVVRMRDVRISDRVVSVDSQGRVCLSPLYLWGHLDPDSETDFLCIRHSGGELRVSENHLVFLDPGEGEGRGEPVPAGRVRVGERLRFVCGSEVQSVEILEVSSVRDVGVYSPFTLNSCIVVNGIVCSVFAVPPGIVRDISQVHRIGHALFAPLRYSYKAGLSDVISFPMHHTHKMHVYCTWLQKGYFGMKPIEKLFFGKTMTEKL